MSCYSSSEREENQVTTNKMKLFLVIVCLVTAALEVQAQKKPLPLGVYMLLPNKDPNLSTEPCRKDTNIVGVTLRLNWSDIQGKGQGDFNWSYFDQGLAQCQNNPYGKKYAVLDLNCGRETPQWVSGQTFTLHILYKGTSKSIQPIRATEATTIQRSPPLTKRWELPSRL